MIYGNYLRNKYNNAAVKLADAEGVPCIMEYSKYKNIRNYEIYGNSVQNGTPSPDNPVEVESVGDFSKNLFDMDSCDYHSSVRQGESIISTTGINVDIYLKAGTYSLTLKCDKECTIFLRKGQVTNGYFASTKLTPNTVSNVLTFTYANDEWMRISSFMKDAVFYDFMLVEGTYDADTMPEYSQYNKYKIPIIVSGKNLFDINSVEKMYTSSGADVSRYLSITDGILKNRYGAYANGTYIPCNIKTLSAGTYTLSCEVSGVDSKGGNIAILWNNGGKSQGFKNPDGTNWKKISRTFTLEEETTINGVRFQGNGGASNYLNLDIYFRNIQIEKSETATEYEPYYEPTTTHIYLNEPLRKIGDYADYVDFKRKKVIRNVKPYVLTGDKWFGKYSSKEKTACYSQNILYTNWYRNNFILCTHFRRIGSVVYDTVGFAHGDTSGIVYFRIPIDAEYAQSATTFQAWVKEQYNNGTPIVIYATPPDGVVEEDIELPTLQTFKGTTVMSVDTAIQPSNIKTKYIRT